MVYQEFNIRWQKRRNLAATDKGSPRSGPPTCHCEVVFSFPKQSLSFPSPCGSTRMLRLQWQKGLLRSHDFAPFLISHGYKKDSDRKTTQEGRVRKAPLPNVLPRLYQAELRKNRNGLFGLSAQEV